jgi:hypothetical protein
MSEKQAATVKMTVEKGEVGDLVGDSMEALLGSLIT